MKILIIDVVQGPKYNYVTWWSNVASLKKNGNPFKGCTGLAKMSM